MSKRKVDDYSLEALRKVDDPRWVREIITPEGIPIRFNLARGGERAGAFVLDVLLLALVLLIIRWALSAAVGDLENGSWLTAVIVILAFLLTNFYFVIFEVRWQGLTPGKKKIGIRVIDARGGQLETSAVLARNLIRELEVWTPLRFLIARHVLWPDAPAWAALAAAAWGVVFLFFPMFNKDRLRIGDMIAGTRVVEQPKPQLVPDLVAEAKAAPAWVNPLTQGTYTFSDEQLSIYGIYELQILEAVLRTDATSMGYFNALRTVADKVCAKIHYEVEIRDVERFLRDFYAAQRAHLEKKMVFGQRREDKYARK